MEQLELERKELSDYLMEQIMTELHSETVSREKLKRFSTGEENYEHMGGCLCFSCW